MPAFAATGNIFVSTTYDDFIFFLRNTSAEWGYFTTFITYRIQFIYIIGHCLQFSDWCERLALPSAIKCRNDNCFAMICPVLSILHYIFIKLTFVYSNNLYLISYLVGNIGQFSSLDSWICRMVMSSDLLIIISIIPSILDNKAVLFCSFVLPYSTYEFCRLTSKHGSDNELNVTMALKIGYL